jgi:phage gp29-like protein
MAQRPKPYSSAVRRSPGRTSMPAELNQVIATTHDGRDITKPYVGELHEFNDRRLLGAVDWGEYDRILLDDQVKSCLTQRIGAVVSREWDVLPGDAEDPRSVAAGDALKANLEDIGWDRVTEKMLYTPFYGFGVAELMWGLRPDGLIGFVPAGRTRAIHVRHARRFRQDKDGRLRLITTTNMTGEILPERKFWEVTVGATDDDQPYGRGLAEWLYWPCLFKRNGIRFWNTFLDKFSVPTAKGTYRPGTPEQDIQRLLSALSSIANDTGFVIPEGMAVELLHVATTGIDFEKLPAFMDAAIAKIILGQTMTNTAGPTGLGSGLADVQAGVKLEVITSDADLLTDSFSSGPARWWTDLNFGADVAAPRVVRLVEEEEDTKTIAEADKAIMSLGYVRTDESFRDTYGDGFERKPVEKAPSSGSADEEGDAAGEVRRQNEGNIIPLRREASFAEAPIGGDIVDEAVAQIMADEGWRTGVLEPFAGSLLAELARAGSEEEVQAILARAAELDDEGTLVTSLERAGFAVRLAATAGQDGAE